MQDHSQENDIRTFEGAATIKIIFNFPMKGNVVWQRFVGRNHKYRKDIFESNILQRNPKIVEKIPAMEIACKESF